MTKNITVSQAVMLEFDLVCAETGWPMPSKEVIHAVANSLMDMNKELTDSDVTCIVSGWFIGQGRV